MKRHWRDYAKYQWFENMSKIKQNNLQMFLIQTTNFVKNILFACKFFMICKKSFLNSKLAMSAYTIPIWQALRLADYTRCLKKEAWVWWHENSSAIKRDWIEEWKASVALEFALCFAFVSERIVCSISTPSIQVYLKTGYLLAALNWAF